MNVHITIKITILKYDKYGDKVVHIKSGGSAVYSNSSQKFRLYVTAAPNDPTLTTEPAYPQHT